MDKQIVVKDKDDCPLQSLCFDKDSKEFKTCQVDWKLCSIDHCPLHKGPVIVSMAGAEVPDFEAENAKLKDALQDLMDQQNGPPLIRDREGWAKAMNKAGEALGHKPHDYLEGTF